jgi:carbamoyltransferase
MSISIGIGGSSHDFSTCLIDDDSRVVAIEDERISRVRYALGEAAPCERSFTYVLESLGISRDAIERVIGNDLLEPSDRRPGSGKSGAVGIARINRERFPPLVLLNHHLMHAYSTFFTGPFEEAAILVMDGSGSPTGRQDVPERETLTLGVGRRNAITVLGSVVGESSGQGFSAGFSPLFHNSLGHLYRAVTQTIGFGWMHAGKTMGLAPYGDDRYVETLMRFVTLLPRGQYQIRIAGKDGLLSMILRLRQEGDATTSFAVDAALAHSVQTIVEEIVFHALDFLWEVTKTPNLCLAGGVALNGLLNGKIPRRTKFQNVHVVSAPGDGGTAVGSAIWDKVSQLSPAASTVRFESGPFWGREYRDDQIMSTLRRAGIVPRRPSDRFRTAAKIITEGKTLAWFEGASEFGPRALGHRSIFADPRDARFVNHINLNIKGREWFRPIAPAVTEGAASTYFDHQCYSPHMQFVWPVREQYRALLPAITHVDGCSRAQTVRRSENESLHRLLEEFEATTGVPVLINTSFNIEGSPIVETPGDAIETFIRSNLDALMIGNYIVEKS